MHRFIWDLRYGRTGEKTMADVEDTGVETWIGPLIMPGLYKVKLVVNGRESIQPLEVAMDPRLHVTNSVLLQQFQWGQRVFEDVVRAGKAVREVEAVQTQLARDKEQLKEGQASLRSAIDDANRAAGDVLSSEKTHPEQGLQSANRALTAALNAIESADRTPPSQAIALYQSSSTMLRARLRDWTTFKQGPLSQLSQQLQQAGLAPIRISVP
jgi:hypothetical protein